MNWTKKLATAVLLLVITMALLELTSLLILKLKHGLSAVQKEFVFKQVQASGEFNPNKNYVLPIREVVNIEDIK